jgi:hypothetical protein
MGDIIKDAETRTDAQGEEKYGELIKAFESAEIDFTQIMS